MKYKWLTFWKRSKSRCNQSLVLWCRSWNAFFLAKAALQSSCSSAYPSLNPEFCHQNMLRDAVGDFMCVTTNDDLYQLLISGGPLGSHVSHACSYRWGDSSGRVAFAVMDHDETESTCGIATWPNQEPYDIIQVSSTRTLFVGPLISM